MAFLRKSTSEGNVGLLYSIIQKCIRRGLEKETLFYSQILYNEATKNSLRKRLVYVVNEDICHLDLSEEIMNCEDEDLFKYVIVCCRLKKTHDSAWLSRLALHYSMNNLKTDDEELLEAMKLTEFVRKKEYESIKQFLGKYNKMYNYSSKNNLVWSSLIMWKRRPELKQEYSIDNIILPEPKKFNEIPFWVKDKHVPGGTKGYQFFFDNSLVVNEAIYEDMWGDCIDRYAEECKKVYLDDEKNLGNGKTKELYKKWDEKDLPDLKDEKIIPGFKNVIQAQLLTRKNNPCVYYVTSKKDNKKYVLKGPMTGKMRKQIMRTETLKKRLKLNHLNVECINLFNQNWMKSDSLLDYDPSLKTLKSSKLEENVYIYSGENCNVEFEMINESFIEIFEQYLLKLLVGANDICARNFIHKDGKVYSIDDHSLKLDIDFNNNIKMKKSLKDIWDKKIIENKEEIINILTKWFEIENNVLVTNRICILLDQINKFEN